MKSVSFTAWSEDKTDSARQFLFAAGPSLCLARAGQWTCNQLVLFLGSPPLFICWLSAFFSILYFLSDSVYCIKRFFLVCLSFFNWNIYNKTETNPEVLVMGESCLGLGRIVWCVRHPGTLKANKNINLLGVFPSTCPPPRPSLSTLSTFSNSPHPLWPLFRSQKNLSGFFQFVVLGVWANPPLPPNGYTC